MAGNMKKINIKKIFKKMPKDLPKDLQSKCMVIIHGASTAAGGVGAGLAQVPVADNALITPIQISMIIALGKVFGQKVTESAAKGIIAGASAALVGRGITQFLVGWMPLIGNAINTATAAGLTEAIGWLAVADFYEENAVKAEIKNDEPSDIQDDEKEEQNDSLIKLVDEYMNGERDYDKEKIENLLDELRKKADSSEDEDSVYGKYFQKLNDWALER